MKKAILPGLLALAILADIITALFMMQKHTSIIEANPFIHWIPEPWGFMFLVLVNILFIIIVYRINKDFKNPNYYYFWVTLIFALGIFRLSLAHQNYQTYQLEPATVRTYIDSIGGPENINHVAAYAKTTTKTAILQISPLLFSWISFLLYRCQPQNRQV